MNKTLYELLIELRNEFAIQSKVSHAMVFTNEVVQEIAQKKPRTMADFQNIHGVNRSGQGEQKAEKYGEAFIKVINGFLTKKEKAFMAENNFPALNETEYAILKSLYSDAKTEKQIGIQFAIGNWIVRSTLKSLRDKNLIKFYTHASVTSYYATKEGQKYIDEIPHP